MENPDLTHKKEDKDTGTHKHLTHKTQDKDMNNPETHVAFNTQDTGQIHG